MKILEEEACAAGANFVNIYDEDKPGIQSSCYQCRANFYLITDSTYTPRLKDFSTDTYTAKKSNIGGQIALYILGYSIGFAFGYFVLGPLLFGKN